jgi:hypothetical protein
MSDSVVAGLPERQRRQASGVVTSGLSRSLTSEPHARRRGGELFAQVLVRQPAGQVTQSSWRLGAHRASAPAESSGLARPAVLGRLRANRALVGRRGLKA